jgi:hypothetical protein
MPKPLITALVDTAGSLVVNANEAVENVVEMVPGGDMFVDKLWSPVTDLVGRIAITPARLLGLTKKFR